MSRLTQAVIKGSLEEVKVAISLGADINETEDVYGRTALHIASDKDEKSIVIELLANGANVNLTDYNGKTPLHLAAEKDNGEIVDYLLENGANEKVKDVNGNTALLTAITHLSYEAGKRLLETDKSQVKEIFDTTSRLIAVGSMSQALIEAASKGRADIISMLEQNGYNIFVFDKDGDSLLHKAVRAQRVDVVSYLVKRCSSIIYIKNTAGVLPIQLVSDRYCLVKKSYKDINIGMILMNTNDDNEVVQIFKHIAGRVCPYWEAAVKGDEQFIKLLLRRRIDKNIQDKNGNTVLHLAASNGHPSILKSFLKIKCDIYARNKQNQTVLDIALDHKNPKIITCIIESGYNVNELDKTTGESLLHSSVKNINEESISKINKLLKLGADVNLKDSKGRTALNLLFLDHNCTHDLILSRIFTLLIRAGSDINTQDNHGYTPLHNIIFNYALTGFWPDFIRLITKEYKPDYAIKDNDGLTSIELALKLGVSDRLLTDENGVINIDFCSSSYENNNIILCHAYNKLIDCQQSKIDKAGKEIEQLQEKHDKVRTHFFTIFFVSAFLGLALTSIVHLCDSNEDISTDILKNIFLGVTVLIFSISLPTRFMRNADKRTRIAGEINNIKCETLNYSEALNKIKTECPFDEHNYDKYTILYDKYFNTLQSKKSFAYTFLSNKKKREEELRIQREIEQEALRIQREKDAEDLRNKCPKCGKLGALITSTEYLGEVTRFRSEVRTRPYRYPLWGSDERLQNKQEHGTPWGQDVRENIPYQVHKSREIRTCHFCGYRIEGKIIEKADAPNEKNTTFGMPW